MYIRGERSRERMMPVRSLCISIREKTIGGRAEKKKGSSQGKEKQSKELRGYRRWSEMNTI